MKRMASSFWNTELEFILRNAGIESLIMTGLNTNGCVFETSISGSNLGFKQILVSDATAAFHPDLEQLIFEMYGVHYGFVRKADEVVALMEQQAVLGPSAVS